MEISAYGGDSDFYFQLAGIDPNLPLWNGHSITVADADAIKEAIESRIQALFMTENPNSPGYLLAAAYFAYKGSQGCPFVERDILELLDTPEGLLARGRDGVIVPAGLLSDAWKFCKEHAKEILIGVAVVAVVTTVVIIAVATGGSGSGPAAAAGGALLNNLVNEDDKKRPSPPQNDPPVSNGPPPPDDSLPSTQSLAAPFDPIFTPTLTSPLSQFLNPPIPPEPPSLFNTITAEPPIAPPPQSGIPFTPTLTSPLSEFLYRNIPLNPISSNTPPSYYGSPLETYELSGANKKPQYLHEEQIAEWERANPNRFITEDELISPNYASTFVFGKASSETELHPPFEEISLIGDEHQSTFHFHCGINNDGPSIVEGGTCLYSTLDEKFAVQPHLIHSPSLPAGLTVVGLEKFDQLSQSLDAANLPTQGGLTAQLFRIPGSILEHSKIQESIDYEVDTLTKIADKILEQGKPNLKQLHITFSNGGHVFNEALKQLSPEQQDTILVITLGTTAIIDENLACKVYNVIGSEDWPSRVCNGGLNGIERAKERADVEVIHQTETDGILGGHYFMQPDYQDKINEYINNEIVNKYEIY